MSSENYFKKLKAARFKNAPVDLFARRIVYNNIYLNTVLRYKTVIIPIHKEALPVIH